MKTFRKAVSVTFSSVLVFGKVPFNTVSANGLGTLRPQKSKKALTNVKEDVAKVTGLRGVEGIFASFGTEQDFQHTDVAGKVAVVTRGLISVGEQIKNAIAAGAVALVMLIAYSLCQTKEDGEKREKQREETADLLQLAIPLVADEIKDVSPTVITATSQQQSSETAREPEQQKPDHRHRKRAMVMSRRIRAAGRSHDSPCSHTRESALFSSA